MSEQASTTTGPDFTSGPDGEPAGPVIRDRRRVDPQTGAVRPSAPGVEEAAPSEAIGDQLPDGGELAAVRQQLTERTTDLQRLQADFTNYRRRVDRDRDAARESALVGFVTALLPVLDDVGRAREHGELEGGFKAVGEALEATVAKLGVERYGEPGEPFDPTVHEALTHTYSGDVPGPTAVAVLQPGYRTTGPASRIVRPARVAVAEPEPGDAG